MKSQINKKSYDSIDLFRVIAVIFVVMNHTYPFANISETADFIITRIIARIAVPFFFMVSGYFVISNIFNVDKEKNYTLIKKSIHKTLKLYCIATIIYIPVNLYSGNLSFHNGILTLLKDILFDGTFYHLWYLPAAIIGMLLLVFLLKYFKTRTVLIISIVLYVVGLGGDSYYYLVNKIPLVCKMYAVLFSVFNYTRNGFFIAPIFLILGALIARQKKTVDIKKALIGFIISLSIMVIEGLVLYKFNVQKHSSMYIMLLPVMFYLFQIILQLSGKLGANKINSRRCRNMSMVAYLIHPLIIVIIRGITKIIGLKELLVNNNLIHFIVVFAISFFIALIYDVFVERVLKIKSKVV